MWMILWSVACISMDSAETLDTAAVEPPVESEGAFELVVEAPSEGQVLEMGENELRARVESDAFDAWIEWLDNKNVATPKTHVEPGIDLVLTVDFTPGNHVLFCRACDEVEHCTENTVSVFVADAS